MLLNCVKTEGGILCDLGNKLTGKFTVKVLGDEVIPFWYGPYLDFLKFQVKWAYEHRDGYTLMTHENVISCRYLAAPLWNGDDGAVTVFFEPEMREEKQQGRFESGNPLLDGIFRVSANTMRACFVKHFRGNAILEKQLPENQSFAQNWRGEITDYVIMDGCRRDREVWVGDLLPEIRSAMLLFDDREIVKNSLAVILDRKLPNGFIPASSISNQVFYEYNCWFAIVLYEYYWLSGDSHYLAQKIDTLIEIMDYVSNLLDDEGLFSFSTMQTWAWTLSREGYITSAHCVISHALYKASLLCGAFQRPEQALRFLKLSERVKASVNRYAYDPVEGCYLDQWGKTEKCYSLDANCFAILFNIAPKERHIALLDKIKEKFWSPYGSLLMSPKETPNGQNWVHNDHVWPFVVSFEVEARFKCGDYLGAYTLMERTWGTMLKNGADTFWEVVDGKDGTFMKERIVKADDDRDTWNSASHGWSAGLPLLLTKYVAGVSPTKPGWAEFELSPHLYDTNLLTVSVRTESGPLIAQLHKIEGGVEAAITLPEGCTGFARLPLYRNGARLEDGVIASSGLYTVLCGDTADCERGENQHG